MTVKRGYLRPSLHWLLTAVTRSQQFIPGMHGRKDKTGAWAGCLRRNPPSVVRCVNGSLEADAVLAK